MLHKLPNLGAVGLSIVLVAASAQGMDHAETRKFLEDNTAAVTSIPENLVDKKETATQIASALADFEIRSDLDAALVARFLTLANPAYVGRKPYPIDLTFPACMRLSEAGEVGAMATLGVLGSNHVAPQEVSSKAAYVLGEAVGVRRAVELVVSHYESSSNIDAEHARRLNEIVQIMRLREPDTVPNSLPTFVPKAVVNSSQTEGAPLARDVSASVATPTPNPNNLATSASTKLAANESSSSDNSGTSQRWKVGLLIVFSLALVSVLWRVRR